jgi:hypothetical protein
MHLRLGPASTSSKVARAKKLSGHVSATAALHAEVHVYQPTVITHYGPVF